MLQNLYLLPKIGADTAGNERNVAQHLPKFGNYPTGPVEARVEAVEVARVPREPRAVEVARV